MSGQPVYMTSKLQTVKTKTSISLEGREYAEHTHAPKCEKVKEVIDECNTGQTDWIMS